MKLLTLLICLLCSVRAFPQDQNHLVDTLRIKSEILQENRKLILYSPNYCIKEDSVNIIYLIDGEYAGYRVQQMKDRFGDSLTNWIFVGIVNTDRRRDLLYVNGAAQFLDFITQELIPAVEEEYKIKKRILYGHSFGGSFTMFGMLSKPGYFNGYIASSPTPIMDLVQQKSYVKMDSTIQNRISFYFSCGSHDMKQVRKWSQKLSNNLTGISFNKLDWQYRIFEGKDHYNSDVDALVNGLRSMK